ncbi:MAG: hypothetical protein ABGW65_04965 [Marinoscillum sp.]|jgi:hypothetical protein
MPKIEKLVKNVTTDDNGERHITWETQMVEENPVQVPETPLGIITLPLGKVFVNDKRGMPKHKLYNGDIIKTGSKSRVEIKIPSGGEVGERWIVRIGETSEFVITTNNLRTAAKSFGIQQRNGNLYDTFAGGVAGVFSSAPKGKVRTPTAVAAIRG